MKKLISLIKACMTSDMNVFKINQKKNGKKNSAALPIVISLCIMFTIWGNANTLFEKMAPLHLQIIAISLFVVGISLFTVIEGVYKTGSLLFNCKDDQLLLSLPIKRSTVLFIRIFKFYVFELIFNSIWLLPIMLAYIRWAEVLDWTYYLVSIIMLFLLPIIPIVISCIIGAITSSLSSRFKYKNVAQIVISMVFCVGIVYLSMNTNGFYNYIVAHATGINDLITKIYYPAGVYASLITKFDVVKLLIFIGVNLVIFVLGILVLSKFYFKINSRLKKVNTGKKVKFNDLVIKTNSSTTSLVKKELRTFFKTPVFIVNAGFSLVLFILVSIVLCIKFNDFLPIFTDPKSFDLSKEMIMNNLSLLIFVLILFVSYTTSITNSVISLEGRNINILKSLPIKTKNILMSKIYSSLILTTPVLLVGDILLFIKFRINIIECILLLVLSILIPLVSHFIGLITNLKYPKLDWENSAEVVKQSTSSFIAVMVGMFLMIISIVVVMILLGQISSLLILIFATMLYTIIDISLYTYITTKGVKKFNKLSI